jgi:hypothetical protein
LTSSHSWDMKRPQGIDDWYCRFVKNEVIENNNERITPGKILSISSMICWFSMRKETRWQEEKPEKQ